MGEGCLLERNPSPIRVRGHIIAPSPARGEGTRGKSHAFWRNEPNRHFGQTKPANVAELFTIKKCPPVIDAMTFGFLMPLACNLKAENANFPWQRDLPAGIASYSRSPIDFHDGCQVAGTPFFDEDRFIIKFNNFWTIQLPPGYSLLVTHPINRD